MSPELMAPPYTPVQVVAETLHGVSVSDPYRWLEDQNSQDTRTWISEQTHYARAYLDSIPQRSRIQERVRDFLAIETCDSLQIVGSRYFFRKRLPDQQQPCIYMRDGADAADELLIDPSERKTGAFTAVKPLAVSPDGRMLLYEVKQGGERTSTFELFDVETRKRLPDCLPHGYLRGFAFAPDSMSFLYVHEPPESVSPAHHAVYEHFLGKSFGTDQQVFFAGNDPKTRVGLVSDRIRIAIKVSTFAERKASSIYVKRFGALESPQLIFDEIEYSLALQLANGRIWAITDRDSPNRRVVELKLRGHAEPEWVEVVPESDALIRSWTVLVDCIVVSYLKEMRQWICVFDLAGQQIEEIPVSQDETVRIVGGSTDSNELVLETESFTQPISIFRYVPQTHKPTLWSNRRVPFESSKYSHRQVWFPSRDGTRIPMFLVGRSDVLNRSGVPVIMTSYGGFGVPMTPQFSVFVAYLMERGCVFALSNIRGGSEFGPAWHSAAKRRSRQVAFDDFLSGAEWLIRTGRTSPHRLAIFGGSNSGLLVGAALTQRPELFAAVVCMVPLLDMLRYHLYDRSHVWADEFGTAELPEDFDALAAYSPYHRVRDNTQYPAVLLISGDADRNCNPLHARKMTARLQAANISPTPILLDYSEFRGHSPVLPLTERINALTDRLAFVCHQLQLTL